MNSVSLPDTITTMTTSSSSTTITTGGFIYVQYWYSDYYSSFLHTCTAIYRIIGILLAIVIML